MLALATLALCLVLVGALLPVLRRAQLVDVPNHRSSHDAPVPRGGGLAVMAAIPLALLFAGGFDAWPVVGVAVALALVGLVDDLRSLPSAVRLVAQAAGGVTVCAWLVGNGALDEWWRLGVACLVVVGFVNAFNFMDGVNGISALTTAVVGAFWAATGAQQDLVRVEVLGLVLLGAGLGFLPWNAPQARVFLGDVGSYGLGLLVAALSVMAWAQGVHWLVALAPLVIYGADTGWVLLKRARGRRPLMEAHREHVYQRMVDHGWSHLSAAGLCASAVALVCLVASLTWRNAPHVGAFVVAAATLAYLAMPRLAGRAEGVSA